jgi:Ser/Thr protein kinase RdoA (MazF antagonist)
MNHPEAGAPGYANLTPQQVLDALDAVGLRGDGRLLQLNSYENRVFQVFLEDGRVVVAKFYRPGRWTDAQILEEHAFALELAEAEVPVIPPLPLDASALASAVTVQGTPPTLATVPLGGTIHRFAVSARCAGREPELEDPAVLRRIGRFIGRLHLVGRRRHFAHRRTMRPAADARAAVATLHGGDWIPHDQRAAWDSVCALAVARIESAFQALEPLPTMRLHGDCHLGNVLWREGGPHVVDLDDAVNGPAVQDLWMLVSGDRETLRRQTGELLEGYTDFADFDPRELRLVEPLRTLRMLRHAAWIAERWSDPAFPAAFPFFGTPAWWSQLTGQLREQLEAMDEAAPEAG